MRNLRKFTAVVIAIALVLTSMTAAFAATTPVNADKAAILKSLGVYSGKDTTDPAIGLEDALTTEQSLTFLTDLFGYADAVNALTDEEVTEALAKFADAKDISTYAKKVIAYAATNGILSGSTKNGKFYVEPKTTVTAARFATFIVKKMGYTVADYKEAVAQLAEVKGSKVAATETGDLTRDAAVGMMFGSLPAELAAGTTVIAGIVGTDAALTAIAVKAGLIVPVVTTLAVDTVTSSNLREVFVKFNKEVEKTTAETFTNYSADAAVVGASLQADKMTVKLLLADGTGAVGADATTYQQKTLDLVIKNVKDVAGTAIVETKKSITLFDTTVPEALSYKFTGPQTIEVAMSEPVCVTHSALAAIVDNGIYGASATVKTGDEKTVVITLGTVIPDGPHKLILKGAKDFANYKMLDKEFAITYTKDSTVSVVSIDAAATTQTKVTLLFSKAVKFEWTGTTTTAPAFFYHTYSAYTPDSVKDANGTVIVSGNYYDKVVLDFTSKPLPAGATKVVVVNKVGDKSVTDRYGIVLGADAVLTATVVSDVTAPTISKVEATTERIVEFTFSEDVKAADVTDKSNYTFKKADGTVIESSKFTVGAYNNTTYKVAVTFTEALAGGAYSAEIKNLKDTSVNSNALIVVPQSFTVSDKTAITTISAVTYVGNVIYVTFPETMSVTGVNSVLNQDNYRWGASGVNAITNAAITVFGTADKVKIELPTGYTPSGSLFVRNVADAAGNILTSLYLEKTMASDASPAIVSVKTIALDKVEIVFDRELSAISADNISFGGITVGQVSYVNKDGKATVTAILKDAGKLTSTAVTISSIQIITGTAIEIKSLTGKVMNATNQALTTANSTDGIAPTVKDVYYLTSSGIIAVCFSEAIDSQTLATLGTNGFKVGDKTVTGAAIATGTTTAPAIVLLYGDFGTSDTAFDLDVTYTPGNLADAKHNGVATFTRTDALTRVVTESAIN